MNIKRYTLTISFLLFALFIHAQDKYEYAIIQHNTYWEVLSVSIDGETYLKEKIELTKDERFTNANYFLKKVKEYEAKEWEILSFGSTVSGGNGNVSCPVYICYMRKKKDSK
jgi:hypothetical protein